MNDRFILVTGSASRPCNENKLDIAVQFVRRFTEEVLRRRGGLVILAGARTPLETKRAHPTYLTGSFCVKYDAMLKARLQIPVHTSVL